MHKTGSSSIQRSLNGFEDEQFVYAALGKQHNHSGPICSIFSSNQERYTLPTQNERSSANVQAYGAQARRLLDAAIDRTRDRTLIISGESISSLSHPDLTRLRNYFRSHFDELRIVAYVRSPAEFISSAFQQRVKGRLNEFHLEAHYFGYKRCFSKFDDLFGRDHVHLWAFNPKSFSGGCVVQDFCARLGIHLPRGRAVRVNESLPRQAVALLYCYRKFGEQYGSIGMATKEAQRLGARLAVLGTDKFRFSPDVVRPILEKNRSDIEWMEARLGEPFREDLGEHRVGDIQDEAALLTPDPGVVGRLVSLLGDAVPKGNRGETPEEVASLVHAVRQSALWPKHKKGLTTSIDGGEKRNIAKVMHVQPNAIIGWAIGSDYDQPVRVALLVNGIEVARSVADQLRPALKARGIHPTGCCGFTFRLRPEDALQSGDQVTIKSLDTHFVVESATSIIE